MAGHSNHSEKVTEGSDAWSLAVTFFRMLGRAVWDPVPLNASQVQSYCLSSKSQQQELAWLSCQNPAAWMAHFQVSQDIATNALGRCLSTDPSRRPTTARLCPELEAACSMAFKAARMSERSSAYQHSFTQSHSSAEQLRLNAYYNDFIVEDYAKAGECYRRVAELEPSGKSFKDQAAFIARQDSRDPRVSLLKQQAKTTEESVAKYFSEIFDLVKTRRIDDALGKYDTMKEKGAARIAMTTLYSVLLDGCAHANPPRVDDALKIFKDMGDNGIFKTERAYNVMIDLCTDNPSMPDNKETALDFFRDMSEVVCPPESDASREFHREISTPQGLKKLTTYAELIDFCTEFERMDDSLMLAQEMTAKYNEDNKDALLRAPVLDCYVKLYFECQAKNRDPDFQAACGQEVVDAVLEAVLEQRSLPRAVSVELSVEVVASTASPFAGDPNPLHSIVSYDRYGKSKRFQSRH